MFINWLLLITQPDIDNQKLLKEIYESEAEMKMAVDELTKLNRDKIKRQSYQRRMDELAV